MKKTLLFGLIALSGLLIAGCLVTGQVTIIEDVDIGVTSNSNIGKFHLNLNENEDYADKIDKIKSIDAVSFVARIWNREDSASTAAIYISSSGSYSTVDQIEDNAIKVLETPPVPANNSILIGWNDSYQYMHNLDSLFRYVKDVGEFYVYAIASPVPFDDSIQAQIVITMTVGN